MGAVWNQVYDIVRSIPAGSVATYGDISRLMGRRISAAAVGWALSSSPDDVPWHRVENAKGRCSLRREGGELQQQARLRTEGLLFENDTLVDFQEKRWGSRTATKLGL